MRICFISSSFFPAIVYGGPISATWDLSRNLSIHGVDIYVSSTNANGKTRLDVERNTFIEHNKNFFIKYYHEQIINIFSFSFIFGIWSDIKKSELVYIQYLFHYTVFFSLLFSVIQGKKIVISPRGSFSSYTLLNRHTYLKKILIKCFFSPFSRFINWHASSYLEFEDIKKCIFNPKIEIIHDGIEFDSFQIFKKYSRKKLIEKYTNLQIKNVSHIFFSMGRLHSIKGFGLLISVFNKFLKYNKNAKLIIAGGDDGVEKKLRKQVEDLNIKNSVFLIGNVSFKDKNILLNNCDFFTLASQFESFGIVVAEALACGKPVLLSNKTPWKNLETNKCGILVNNEKNSFMTGFLNIVKMKYDSKLIKNHVKSNYDWSIVTNKFLYFFKSI